jgi:Fe-S cluster assembly ATP-binding protein
MVTAPDNDISDISIVPLLIDGQIVHTGGKELALKLEEKGYDWVKEELLAAA